MDIAALIVWVITAIGGLLMLGIWIRNGGIQQQRSGASRLPAPVIFGHFALAATGLVLWIIYVATDARALAWIAFVLLLPVAALGFLMLSRWLPVRRDRATAAAPAADQGAEGTAPAAGTVPAERHFPVPLVRAHGMLAVATVVLVFLTALGVG